MNITRFLKFYKFLIAGGTGFTTNIVFLYFLTDVLGWWYLVSSISSFVISVVVSFTLQKFWVFGDISTDKIHTQSTIFLGLAIVNLFVNTFLMFMNVDIFGLHYLFAQVISSGIIAIWSFWIYRFLFASDKLLVDND